MNEVLTAADVASSSRTSMAPPSSTSSLASNLPLVSAFFAFSLAQFLKLFTTWSPSKFWRPITAVTWKNLASNACTRMRFFEALLWECLVPNRFKEKRWDSRRLLGSGGMPSSHSATVVALAVAIGLQEGAGSSSFALAVILASIVMYDASGIRLHAGRQAELLNQIVCELPPEHPLSSVRPLREPLGHTPLQVCAGAVLGCFVSYLMRYSG